MVERLFLYKVRLLYYIYIPTSTSTFKHVFVMYHCSIRCKDISYCQQFSILWYRFQEGCSLLWCRFSFWRSLLYRYTKHLYRQHNDIWHHILWDINHRYTNTLTHSLKHFYIDMYIMMISDNTSYGISNIGIQTHSLTHSVSSECEGGDLRVHDFLSPTAYW